MNKHILLDRMVISPFGDNGRSKNQQGRKDTEEAVEQHLNALLGHQMFGSKCLLLVCGHTA